MRCSVDRFPAVAAFVAGSPRRWSDLHDSRGRSAGTLQDRRSLRLVLSPAFSISGEGGLAASAVCESLSETARVQAGEELLRGAETRAVLDALTRAGISPILIKGTPLAYTVYDAPALRPREDTDLLIAPAGRRGCAARAGFTRIFGDRALSRSVFAVRDAEGRSLRCVPCVRRSLEDQHAAGLRERADVRRHAAARAAACRRSVRTP